MEGTFVPQGSGPLGSGPTGPGSGYSVMPNLRVCFSRFLSTTRQRSSSKHSGALFAVILGENIHFSISSYSVSPTFKAHNDTLFEANSSFENGRNLM